ncbi:probable 4-coumarate--CoA ligase 1 [Neocloeon triangulifer]|uniref:probable 4-coumarate--CoA ligase 1 n=1 Tax=Neocloeon triangulifer TaxID=2078957 RepID=UPI00286F2BD0|nr:probable 4-coumarate--CoA ligase 1 [Neocloeon triangulifer]
MFALVGRRLGAAADRSFLVKRNIFHEASKIFTSDSETHLPTDVNFVDYVWKDYKKWERKFALTCGISGRNFTYGQTFGAFDRLSVNLPSELNLKSGDVVAVLLPNMPEFPITFFGAASAGLIISPLNPLYTPDELRKLLACSKAKVVVTIASLLPKVRSAFEKSPGGEMPVILVGEDDTEKDVISFEKLISKDVRGIPRLEKPGPENVVVLPFSSGTTGSPKGVVLTHLNLVANVNSCSHPHAIWNFETGDDSTIGVIPFFHIYGLVILIGITISRGNRLITLPKFDPNTFVNALKTYKPSYLFLVPPLIHHIARSPQITSEMLSNLKMVGTGAAPINSKIIDEFLEKTKNAGTIVKNGYGMTETSGGATSMQESLQPNQQEISIGKIISNAEVKIVGEKDEALPLGEEGELWIRGPHIMKGYLDNDQATKEILTEDGWLRTGDVARMHADGSIYIVDRLKELIKVNGFQVSPTELEGLLITMPGVADVAVIGVPHNEQGEVPRAFVVKREGLEITAKEVEHFLEPKVAKFKRLGGGVQFVDEIPKSAAGKILRRNLKAMIR